MHIPETFWDKAVVRLHLWVEFPALDDSKSSTHKVLSHLWKM